MHEGYVVLLLFVLLTGLVFYQAYQGHSETILTGFLASVCGLLAAWAVFQFVMPALAGHMGEPTARQRMLAGGILGLGVWIAVRSHMRRFVQWLHSPGQPLGGCSEGIGAGLVSLVPSLITVLLLGVALRWAGTVAEMRTYAALCHPSTYYATRDYPHWSGLATWRDGWEKFPPVEFACNLMDNTAKERHRKLVALVLASMKAPFFENLKSGPTSAGVLTDAALRGLVADPEIVALRDQGDWLSLLHHRKLHAAALDHDLKAGLDDFKPRAEADRFFLSESWQATVKLEKEQHRIVDQAEKERRP